VIKEETCVISPPKFGVTDFYIEGIAPLVVERFSKKAELMAKMAEGQAARNKKTREARDFEKDAEEARYRSAENWEGMNAAAFRAAMISACRLVGFKMTLAKLSAFIEADGFDKNDGVPLVRIYGESHTYTAHTRNATGVVDVRARPMYRNWAARLRVRYDTQQFKMVDVLNLVSRCGLQVGIGAGRPDSKASAGCGFGLFQVVPTEREKEVIKKYGIQ
jgi:hypothetical protein